MYKWKYITLSFVIVIAFVVLIVITPNNRATAPDIVFSSPEKAIEEQLLSIDYELVESNGVYFAVCDTAVNDYACQYIVNNGDGWQVVTDYMFKNAYFYKRDKNGIYEICIREYMDKYFVYISQTQSSTDKHGPLKVMDSLNNSFAEMEFDLMRYEHYWFLCLDNMPDNYSVSINSDVVFAER